MQRLDQIESHRAAHEFWTIGLAARVYPWSLPISIGTGVTNFAAYDQDWMDRQGVDRVQVSQPPPFDRRSVTQGDVNEWRYSYDTIIDGFHRFVHDFAPEDQARLFHDNARRIYRIPA